MMKRFALVFVVLVLDVSSSGQAPYEKFAIFVTGLESAAPVA
jgi:hypothetical protein